MTLSLATRGYLCQGRGTGIGVVGPEIIDARSVTPEVIGAATVADEGPDIVGSEPLAPSGSGTSQSQPPSIEGPNIVGADQMRPGITGADEDD